MRVAFVKKLTELALNDKDLYFITADTGFKVFDEYQNIFSDRYLNIGISESAMVSIASGLALSGKRVFLYGIVPFVVMRCFEQIRNDLCMQNLPVVIVGVGAGLVYGREGATHHSIEDIAVMNALPNMTVVCPGDPVETSKAMEATTNLKGPMYLRLGKSGEQVIHQDSNIPFEIGEGIVIEKGADIAIVSTGNMLTTATELANMLRSKGMTPEVISMHTVKPIDRDLIVDVSKRCRMILTLEEHSTIGGLGSCVANVISEENLSVMLKKFAIGDQYADVAGSHSYLKRHFGLTAEQIFEKLLPSLNATFNKHHVVI